MIKNGNSETSFYYPNGDAPMVLILDKGEVSAYYNPTHDVLLQIEEEFGLDANEVENLIKRMDYHQHTLMIDVEVYLKGGADQALV